MPTFKMIWKKKAVEEFSPIPYLATLLNSMLWLFYGLPLVTKDGTLIYIINGVGLALETIYLTIFFIYAPNDCRCKVLKILGGELLFVAALVTGVIVGVHSLPKRANICLLCYFRHLQKLVIQTKSVEYMPFFLSLAGFLNAVCWTIYAITKFDVNILIPNGLGALFGLSQLILYFYYYGSTPKKSSSRTSTRADVEMATVDDASSRTSTRADVEMAAVDDAQTGAK